MELDSPIRLLLLLIVVVGVCWIAFTAWRVTREEASGWQLVGVCVWVVAMTVVTGVLAQ